MGNPDPEHVSTSYVERQNLSMRMHMRRFTRLTNAFSKKVTNHLATLAVYFMYYNVVRISPNAAGDASNAGGSDRSALERGGPGGASAQAEVWAAWALQKEKKF